MFYNCKKLGEADNLLIGGNWRDSWDGKGFEEIQGSHTAVGR